MSDDRRIWMFRHGQSLANAGERTSDPTSIALSQKGVEQSHALAESLDEAPVLIVSSPFIRSGQTAAPIAARYPSAKQEIWPIQEFTYLDPATCINTNRLERKPRIDAYWNALDCFYRDGPGAESFADSLQRVRDFLSRLISAPLEFTVIIGHGQFMQAAYILADEPDLDPQSAMEKFRAEERADPFANCERLSFTIANGVLKASHNA